LNKAALIYGDVGDLSKDVKDENIAEVNELDAENNNGGLNEADLIYGDVDNTRKDVEFKNIVWSWQHIHNFWKPLSTRRRKRILV